MKSMVPGATNFSREQKLYESRKREWLREHGGEFALIKGNEVLGFFAEYEDALRSGLKQFGFTAPFFIKQVCAQEPVFTIY